MNPKAIVPSLIALSTLAAVLTGCGSQGGHLPTPTPIAGPALTGHVFGGQQPITGAVISLYAVGTSGNGASNTSLLTLPVVTGAFGTFSITGDYSCPTTTTQIYLVARGGNPGLTAGTLNNASVMMAPLGDCGNLQPTTFITVNEITTVASAWALSQFLAPSAVIGSSSTNAVGIRNAFLVANNLVNVATGVVGGSGLPAGSVIETAKLQTLADVIAVCVNSNGGAACAPLFAAATNGGVAPTNTLDAALSIVTHPAANVAAVFNANNPQGPFQPVLTNVPNDWTMSITYSSGGLLYPTTLSVDSTGSVWIANYNGNRGSGGYTSKLSPIGAPVAGSPFFDSNSYENYGLTVDSFDNVWVTNEETKSQVNGGFGSLTKFDASGTLLSGSGIAAGGVYFPYAVAADSNGNIWLADYGRSGATLLNNAGATLSGNAGYRPADLPFPTGIALDANHNAWFAAQGKAVIITPSGAATTSACCNNPSGVALDPMGNVWISDYSASTVIQLTSGGAVNQRLTSGGIAFPESLTVDGIGQVWAANYHGRSISGFSAVTSPTGVSSPLSPATGFGIDAAVGEPFSIAVDASGNVWTSDFSFNTLVQFVGLASPRKTPLIGLPVAP